MTPSGVFGKSGDYGNYDWCAVVETTKDEYSVVPCFDRFDMGRPWPEDGDSSLDEHSYLLVKAAPGCKPEELLRGVESLVRDEVAKTDSKRGWNRPSLDTLAQTIQTQPFVAIVKRETR